MQLRLVIALAQPEAARRISDAGADLDVDIVRLPSGSGSEVYERAAALAGDVVVLDRRDLGQFAEVTIELLRELPEHPSLVVLSEFDDPEDRARLVACGCDAVLGAGLGVAMLREALKGILDRRRQESHPAERDAVLEGPRLADFSTGSDIMAAFVDTARRVAQSNASLLLLGETGAGKEHLARAIHAESPRSSCPFLAVNCGAIPENLLESELFGHERGSFTGATRARKGWFEQAHSGTLFLDEVGELPLHLQVKLLRVLQFHEVRRVGSERDIPVDVRIIAATNRDVEGAVAQGAFRADLYYRLSVVTLEIPPLRERREELPALIEKLSHEVASAIGRPPLEIGGDAQRALLAHDWPGNVRELRNVLERATLLSVDGTLRPVDLPRGITGVPGSAAVPGADPMSIAIDEACLMRSLPEARQFVVEAFERRYLEALLQRTRGRVGEAAKQAGVDPRSLYNKLRALGMKKEDFR